MFQASDEDRIERRVAVLNAEAMPQPQPAFPPAATGGPVAARFAQALWPWRKPGFMRSFAQPNRGPRVWEVMAMTAGWVSLRSALIA